MSPLCESYLPPERLDSVEPFYPLHVSVCRKCLLVQLNQYVTADHIFTEYAYFSSFSTAWLKHAEDYVDMISKRLELGAKSFVVELASNDGYLLQYFVKKNIPCLGIEPAANVAEVARGKGVDTQVTFFGRESAAELVANRGRADLIIGNNVLAQVPDINSFVGGVAIALAPNGTATFEFPHLKTLFEQNQFDTIYHEHFSYFSLVTIDRMAKRHGLKVFDVEEIGTHGGSLRVYLCRDTAAHAVSAKVTALLAHEREIGFENIASYAQFAAGVHDTKRKLLSFLIQAKEKGARICGYGAPGKGNTLLNYCGIGTDFLDFTVDRNPYKHGRYTPGMHIPIYPVEVIDEVKPDYLFILPWNLKNEIVAQMRHIGEWGGKFIVPIPTVHVIDPKELSKDFKELSK
jgi:C-methyltransferase C-terminal domain/Methyltransferase domain/Putative zinc binding domain